MEQRIISARDNYSEFDEWIKEKSVKKLLIVGNRAQSFQISFQKHLKEIEETVELIKFSDYESNPLYDSVVAGVSLFRTELCDAIVAIGGGSAIDVAKCIKLYGNMSGDGSNGSYLKQEIVPNSIPFLVMPTTAGTGSEATRYAVIYYQGEKQSITNESIIPDTVLMDSECLKTLSSYQKKAAMMDAFCHAIESFWSVNSTNESKRYSREALETVLKYMNEYLLNTDEGNRNMLMAAHLAGKAINITQTTAGHAMCYKITSLFGVAHGHAAILCNKELFSWMIWNTDKCVDPRGKKYLVEVFQEIAYAMRCEKVKDAVKKMQDIFDTLDFYVPTVTESQYRELNRSVNPVRLRNHPIELTVDTIDMLYHRVLRQKCMQEDGKRNESRKACKNNRL